MPPEAALRTCAQPGKLGEGGVAAEQFVASRPDSATLSPACRAARLTNQVLMPSIVGWSIAAKKRSSSSSCSPAESTMQVWLTSR